MSDFGDGEIRNDIQDDRNFRINIDYFWNTNKAKKQEDKRYFVHYWWTMPVKVQYLY